MNMNKILLIPGSFNPITNAHVDMALVAKKAIKENFKRKQEIKFKNWKNYE